MTYSDDWLTVHVGDCRQVLATLPERSVHTVCTSPPYWGLRDYGHGDQLGLEPTPEEYVANMVAVFREVRRVLRDDGTLWLNLGDSYFSHDPGGYREGEFLNPDGRPPAKGQARNRAGQHVPGAKRKDLVGIPWRVAFALQADGWHLRSDIIWSKPNPMPESVTDRPTKSHEYLFLLSKRPTYFFDADAVREAYKPESIERIEAGFQDRYGKVASGGYRGAYGGPEGEKVNPAGRNIRSVWSIATQPYPGAHFATFPPKLVEPCIKAGTSERGVCPDCGSPWRRVVERDRHIDPRPMTTGAAIKEALGDMARTTPQGRTAGTVSVTTTGWQPTCDHGEPPVPATVLDPFGGSGTTAMVAQSLGRRAILIELNPDYIEQQMARNAAVPLGLDAA